MIAAKRTLQKFRVIDSNPALGGARAEIEHLLNLNEITSSSPGTPPLAHISANSSPRAGSQPVPESQVTSRFGKSPAFPLIKWWANAV
jgi:hypothetical protein